MTIGAVAPRPASHNEPIHAQIKPQRQPAESYVNETDKGNLAEIYGDTPSVPKKKCKSRSPRSQTISTLTEFIQNTTNIYILQYKYF